MADLEIKNLRVSVEGKEILKGVNLEVNRQQIVALMGPNGSGKTSLSYSLMGHPKYKVTSGEITFMGKNITSATPTDRARMGLFLSFQYPAEIPGVSVQNFLRTAYNSVKKTNISVLEFNKLLNGKLAELSIERQFVTRGLNEGFSGGEKKRMEILQMSLLTPQVAILDETDSGLDVDSLKIVAQGILRSKSGVLLITHYQRILNHIKPDKVYIMAEGEIAAQGTFELAAQIEKEGYEFLRR